MSLTLLLQVVNGYIAVSAIVGAYIFGQYIWTNRKIGFSELRPALCVFPVFVGVSIIYAPVFCLRTYSNATGTPYDPPMLLIIIGSILVEAGFLCKIKVFAPQDMQRVPYITALIASTVIVGASLLFV